MKPGILYVHAEICIVGIDPFANSAYGSMRVRPPFALTETERFTCEYWTAKDALLLPAVMEFRPLLLLSPKPSYKSYGLFVSTNRFSTVVDSGFEIHTRDTGPKAHFVTFARPGDRMMFLTGTWRYGYDNNGGKFKCLEVDL